tara:strand:+ start:1318 stop:3006 length:1689 start_codon:yes stop_codon:yes gene_type:complete
MSFNLDSLFIEWRRIVPTGVPNPKNAYHLTLLKEICLSKGISTEIVDSVMLVLEAEEKPLDDREKEKADKMGLKWKGKGYGKESEKGISHKNVDGKLVAVDGDEEKEEPSGDKITPNEFESDPDKGGGYLSKDKKDDIESKDEKPKGTSTKSFQPGTVKKNLEYVDKANEIAEKQENPDIKKAMGVLNDNWKKFVNAKTEEEKIEAVESMVDYGLIERNQFSKKTAGKIYISSNAAGIPYKHFMGVSGTGNAVTEDMNRIIRENGLEVNMRNNSADRALADLSGKHNEAGVVALLDSSEENQKQYEELRKKYQELGNDDSEAHEQNKTAVELIKKSLPEGSKVTKSIQVGGIGGSKLMDLYGIDEKVDPTDMLVVYDDKDGNEQTMKISAKIYSNPNDITMKNSGTKSAGRTYLGEAIGAPIDAKLQEMRDRNNYQEDGLEKNEQDIRKRAFREEYVQEFGAGMKKLAETEQGQEQLVQMWKDVHGCGHDVHTLIVNKKTGESQIKKPEHYCDPKPPFDIKYDGGKVVINLETQTDEYVQIDCKTEMNSSPKLLFKHKVKKG